MREISLTQGQVALVDDDNYEELIKYNWYAVKYTKGYGYGAVVNINRTLVYMHRMIMNTPLLLEVDHLDGNTLNNQKSNLRNCTHKQNMMNISKRYGTSIYKGVHKRKNRWLVQIQVDGRKIYIGSYKSELEAAKAYDNAAINYFNKFARTNFIMEEVK